MALKILASILLFHMVTLARTNDVRLGYAGPGMKKIYSEIKQADPALWKRTDDVIVNAVGNEVIGAISVTDLRDDKDGEAFIESGGIGQKSVTIGLRSPSILRGYRFEIEVYAEDPSESYYNSRKGYSANVGNVGLYTKGGAASYSDDGQYARKY